MSHSKNIFWNFSLNTLLLIISALSTSLLDKYSELSWKRGCLKFVNNPAIMFQKFNYQMKKGGKANWQHVIVTGILEERIKNVGHKANE